MFELAVYDLENRPVGLLQDVSSIQWLENYQKPGEVKITARPTPEVLALVWPGYRLYNKETGTAARIVHTEIQSDVNADTLSVRAVLGGQLLEERVVMGTEIVDNAEEAIYAIYNNNRRGLPLECAAPKGFAESIVTEASWGSVLEAVGDILEATSLGMRVVFDPATGGETMEVYRGVDRTSDASEEYIGYFGDDIGNLASAVITSSCEDFKNVAVVAGEEEEDGARIVVTVSPFEAFGEARREVFVDAGRVKKKYRKAHETGEVDEKGNPVYEYTNEVYTNEEYEKMLESKGFGELAKHLTNFEVRCEIDQSYLKFGVDYYLGDRLPVKLLKYGLYFSAVVSSATRIYESSGHSVMVDLTDFRLEEML